MSNNYLIGYTDLRLLRQLGDARSRLSRMRPFDPAKSSIDTRDIEAETDFFWENIRSTAFNTIDNKPSFFNLARGRNRVFSKKNAAVFNPNKKPGFLRINEPTTIN